MPARLFLVEMKLPRDTFYKDRPTTSAQQNRVPALDGLRALAIILVVACHAQVFLKLLSGRLAYFCTEMAWSGVYLFFVLSGYLIGRLVLSEVAATGRIRILPFWGRRSLRTWPLYFLALFGNYFVLPPLAEARAPALYRFMTFTQVFSPMNYFIESWSLCIEELFYLVLPIFLLLVLWLARAKRIGIACVLVISVSYVFRFQHGFTPRPGATFDSLFMGVLIARLDQGRSAGFVFLWKWPWMAMLTGVAIFSLTFALGGRHISQCQGLLSIAFGLILISALNPTSLWAKLLSSRVLQLIALSSYSSYLTHVLAIRSLGHLGFAPHEASRLWAGTLFVGAGLSTLVIGWFVYQLIEKPMLGLREVLLPRGSLLEGPSRM
jgi:peptidoglycan/LPS O-acetylase OafA/YrhL